MKTQTKKYDRAKYDLLVHALVLRPNSKAEQVIDLADTFVRHSDHTKLINNNKAMNEIAEKTAYLLGII